MGLLEKAKKLENAHTKSTIKIQSKGKGKDQGNDKGKGIGKGKGNDKVRGKGKGNHTQNTIKKSSSNTKNIVHTRPKKQAKKSNSRIRKTQSTSSEKVETKKRAVSRAKKILSSYIPEDIVKEISLQKKKGVRTPRVNVTPSGVRIERPAKTTIEKIDINSIKESIEEELSISRQKTTISSEDRLSSGIADLDGVMGGGFIKNTVNLIVGGPGSGKSTLAMQFLVSGIEDYNEPGVYVSFEQSEREMKASFKQFTWNLPSKIKNNKITLLTYTPEQVQKVLETGGGTIRDVVEKMGATRIVIDSLTAFTILHDTDLSQRKACIDLFQAIKSWGCTALLISEQDPDPEKRTPSVEEFEVDGVILLYNMRKGDVRERALEVFKMRGTSHSAKLFPLKISKNGMMIFPDQTIF
jgi:KaiC/GvpD/RAD55 family RecA-like ATPase